MNLFETSLPESCPKVVQKLPKSCPRVPPRHKHRNCRENSPRGSCEFINRTILTGISVRAFLLRGSTGSPKRFKQVRIEKNGLRIGRIGIRRANLFETNSNSNSNSLTPRFTMTVCIMGQNDGWRHKVPALKFVTVSFCL